jgi:hypothetical protein
MMGRLTHEQEKLFYEFRLEEVVPNDHLVREIAGVLDLSWVRAELASYYSPLGRLSIDPLLMIRMLVVGYVVWDDSGNSIISCWLPAPRPYPAYASLALKRCPPTLEPLIRFTNLVHQTRFPVRPCAC